MSAEQWGLVIQTELVKIWVDSMTAIEQDKYAGACDEQGRLNLDRVPADVYASLDEAILHQAEALGWRITLSELVRFRFSAWEQDPDGPELFKKLGMAMRRSALIMQKRELPPIEDPDQWPVKKETVEELRLVLERLRAAFAPRRSVIWGHRHFGCP